MCSYKCAVGMHVSMIRLDQYTPSWISSECTRTHGYNTELNTDITGSVAERSKALVLGTSLNEAWVRIPPLPMNFDAHKYIAYVLHWCCMLCDHTFPIFSSSPLYYLNNIVLFSINYKMSRLGNPLGNHINLC
jgi:hypothetical protein